MSVAQRVFNRVVSSVMLQCASAGLVFLNQIVILRFYGVPAYGDYQQAYALLMACPTFLTLGIFNLASDPKFGSRAFVPALLIATILTPLAAIYLHPMMALAAYLFTISHVVGYWHLTKGNFVKRIALAGGVLNISVLAAAATDTIEDSETLLLLGTTVSACCAALLASSTIKGARNGFRQALTTLKEVRLGHYALFAFSGILSNLTYILPLIFAQRVFTAHDFGLAAFGLALARLPFLFSGAINSIIARPTLTRDFDEVARLSRMLSTLGLASTALLALNADLVLHLAGIELESRAIVIVALYSFVGATLWGSVADISWFTGNFRFETFAQLCNVLITASASLATYWFEFNILTYLLLVATSTVASYYVRFRFVNRVTCRLTIDVRALIALALSIPIVVLGSRILSIVVSIPIAAYVIHQVWSRDQKPTSPGAEA